MSRKRRKKKAVAIYLLHCRRYQRRTVWVHPLLGDYYTKGEFAHVYKEYRSDPDRFFKLYRMYPNQFDYLLSLVEKDLEKKTTNYREPLTPEFRLVVTIT